MSLEQKKELLIGLKRKKGLELESDSFLSKQKSYMIEESMNGFGNQWLDYPRCSTLS